MTNLEKGKISGLELVYLVVSFLIGSSIIITPGRGGQQDAWLVILLGAAGGGVLALVFTTLARRFPGKTIVEILEVVFGRYFGKAIAASFVWYLFHLGSLVVRNFSDFFTTAVMPETPALVFAIFLVVVSAFAVSNGLEVIARCSLILLPITVGLILVTILLQLNQLDFKNFLPILETPWSQLLKSVHSAVAFPFGEAVIFLMILPFLNQPQAGRRRTFFGIILAALFIDLLELRSIGALGVTRDMVTYPSLDAVKLINVPFLNVRLEIIVVVNFLTMGFLKIALLHYCTVLGLGQIFRFHSMRPLIVPVGTWLVLVSLINYSSSIENYDFIEVVYPIYALPFQLVIPLVTLLVALIRKLPSGRTGC